MASRKSSERLAAERAKRRSDIANEAFDVLNPLGEMNCAEIIHAVETEVLDDEWWVTIGRGTDQRISTFVLGQVLTRDSRFERQATASTRYPPAWRLKREGPWSYHPYGPLLDYGVINPWLDDAAKWLSSRPALAREIMRGAGGKYFDLPTSSLGMLMSRDPRFIKVRGSRCDGYLWSVEDVL